MQLVSWNLNGLEDGHLDERTEAAMFQILLGAPIEKAMVAGFKPNMPDIIVLQEVVERSFHAHIKKHLKMAGFHLFPDAPTERSYFEIIASREAFEETQYQKFSWTNQGRGLSIGKLESGLTIMTAHMESQKPGSLMRIDQAKEILTIMPEHSPCIFAGDTNLREEEWSSIEKGEVTDAWEVTGSPKAHKVTWQNKVYKARYDRVWTQGLTIDSFKTFGSNRIKTIKESSSDHKALRVSFST